MIGKRFIVAIIGIICASVVTIILKYDAKSYIQLFGIALSVYTLSQTITDHKKGA